MSQNNLDTFDSTSVGTDITHHLTRYFGKLTAVKDLSIEVTRGCIYEFLGPNGSGKTTTIRMLLGLIRPDKGKVKLFDTSLASGGKSLLNKVGSLIEAPSLYPHLTGRENLEITRRLLAAPANILTAFSPLSGLKKMQAVLFAVIRSECGSDWVWQ